MSAEFRIETLHSKHDRQGFSCGQEALDRYFQTQVSQDIRRNITHCFLAVHTESGRIAAYYTLAATSIPTPDLPEALIKKLPRYPSMPAARIGRLAVDRNFQGCGLGGALLADAASRALSAGPAAFALVVDAKDDQAIAFYKHHGLVGFARCPRTLYLVSTAATRLLGT